MSWLAKINLNTVVKRLGTFRSAILLLLLIVISLFSGYRIGNFFHGYQQQTIAQQQQRLENLYATQAEQVRRINTLEVELEVERLASQKSQKLLTEIEQQHFQVKKELAFYEKVMAPEKQADGLVIDNVVISPTTSLDHYRFQVVLVQQRVKKRYAKGYIELSLAGSLNEKPYKLALEKIANIKKEDLNFSFQYFQIIEGEFTLPENFKPEQLLLAAVLPKRKWQKYYRIDENYLWQNVMEKYPQTTSLILD
ncbi:hypothetical protein tinsulaeT_12350 [Thalassotalea insulae]|uniref:Uncharacterized protein n=1 Tax=Thalassotalea insulae TaxID=2056778 RepID=A0ABQ6GPH8_9GAMM|nr:DUF6776 family protein [Thalassotalea insulae]GLX77895.1 hypothetical protein tinsulaeT_12350 [Thalassotalea insulae]